MSGPLYEVRRLRHWYRKNRVVLDVGHLDIHSCSIIGLYGVNGSGKSTLIKILGGLIRPSEGVVKYDGFRLSDCAGVMRLRVATLPQNPVLLKRSVFRNIAYGLALRNDRHDLENRITQALAMVGLDFQSFAGRAWSDLSGGERQRVALAARLILKPEALLLDEPTANLDVRSGRLVKEAVLRANREWGTTFVIASHDKQWLADVCDSVLHMMDGRLFETEQDVNRYVDEQLVSEPFIGE